MKRQHVILMALAVSAASPLSAQQPDGKIGDSSSQIQQVIYVSASDLADAERRSIVRRVVHAAARTVCRAHRYSVELERACIAGTVDQTFAELSRAAVRLANKANQTQKIAMVVALR